MKGQNLITSREIYVIYLLMTFYVLLANYLILFLFLQKAILIYHCKLYKLVVVAYCQTAYFILLSRFDLMQAYHKNSLIN